MVDLIQTTANPISCRVRSAISRRCRYPNCLNATPCVIKLIRQGRSRDIGRSQDVEMIFTNSWVVGQGANRGPLFRFGRHRIHIHRSLVAGLRPWYCVDAGAGPVKTVHDVEVVVGLASPGRVATPSIVCWFHALRNRCVRSDKVFGICISLKELPLPGSGTTVCVVIYAVITVISYRAGLL